MIKLYTSIHCPSCENARNYLNNKKIDFTEVNITGDVNLQKELIKKTGQLGVPVIEVNGIMIVGFNKEALSQMLDLKEVMI